MTIETSIALASAIVAGSALIVTVWSAWATRRHHRLSVRPHISKLTEVETSGKKAGFVIVNSGLGPALIKSIRIFVDGEEHIIKRPSHWKDLIDKLDLPMDGFKYYIIGEKDAINAGSRELLLQIFFPTEMSNHDKILRELQRIKVVINYESMYGEKFSLSSRSSAI